MKLSEIYKIADEIAPKSLSDEMCEKYGFYDNSGILVDVNEEINAVVFSLDLSEGAIDLAIERGANLILTHHPAIYGKISKIDYHEDLLSKKLIRCIKNGVSVLSMHLNLDGAKDGIDESLAEGIALAANCKRREEKLQMPLSAGGYGRSYALDKISLGDLAKNMGNIFQTERVTVYGDKKKAVGRVASFCGAGADEGTIAFALATGADTMISSDFKHHLLARATELGLSVITLTHYASEAYGFRKYYEKISRQANIPCVYHADENLL